MLSYALCSTYVPQIESLPREILLILDDYLGYKKLEIAVILRERRGIMRYNKLILIYYCS